MALCKYCRAVWQSLPRQLPAGQHAGFATKSQFQNPSPSGILSKPTWSIRTLLSSDSPTEKITPSQLHHLLRLSALPLPQSPDEEQRMINTLQSQLRFVRAVRNVNTKGIEPLRVIRDETEAGVKEMTVGLEELRDVLEKEVKVGYYQRPRRVRGGEIEEPSEQWDVLGTAGRKAGKFFVVDAGKKEKKGEA